jgi:hypothetical protein
VGQANDVGKLTTLRGAASEVRIHLFVSLFVCWSDIFYLLVVGV